MSRLLTILLLAAALQPLAARTGGAPDETTAVLDRGQRIATAITAVTSTAVSPLVGVCAVGAFDYFKTPKERRAQLPFYDSPKFWIPVSVLLLLILLKDTVGGFAPLLKKPLDAVEVMVVNKASLVLIAFPMVFNQVAQVFGYVSWKQWLAGLEPVAYAAAPGFMDGVQKAGTATAAGFMILAGLIMAFVIWLVGHAFDVLTILCPFPFFDLLLKGFRNAVLVALAVTALVSREAGLVLSLIIFTVCLLLAGWALRLAIFGSVFSWGLIRLLVFDWRATPREGDALAAFTAARVEGLPKRTFGGLRRKPDGAVEFRCRRFGFGPAKAVRLKDAARCEIGRGMFHPCIVETRPNSDKHRILFRLLPKYKGSEEAIRALLGMAAVRDLRWARGLKAFWGWLADDAGAKA